jgi:acetyltransferase-like isoleucine patch superfamily enzyme
MVGERCEIGHGVVAAPGVIIGNRCRVGALKVLDRSVPDSGLVV